MDTGYLDMDSCPLSVKGENSSDKRGLIINIEEYRAKEKDFHKELFSFFVKKCNIEPHRYKGKPFRSIKGGQHKYLSLCVYMYNKMATEN